MIVEIDEALRSLIRDRALSGTEVEVVFDAPTTDWAARRNAPTVNVYLYDIREDTSRREYGLEDRRDAEGTVTSRRPAARRFKLSYLVTAWTQRPEDEHRLLDSLLRGFLSYDALPHELVPGLGLRPTEVVPVSIALPPPEDRAFADVWSSLGGELKPSLDVVVTAPLTSGVEFAAGPPVTELPLADFSDTDGRRVELRRQLRPRPGVVTEQPSATPRKRRPR